MDVLLARRPNVVRTIQDMCTTRPELTMQDRFVLGRMLDRTTEAQLAACEHLVLKCPSDHVVTTGLTDTDSQEVLVVAYGVCDLLAWWWRRFTKQPLVHPIWSKYSATYAGPFFADI